MTTIKTFMDFTCPFSYLGFTILNKLRKEEPDIKHIWFPYILNPDTPLNGSSSDEKFDEEKKKQISDRLNKLGEEYGLKYNNLSCFFNTNRAHRAALYARDKDKFYDFAENTFKAVFERGENIACDEALNQIAESVGLDARDMNSKIDEGLYEDEMKKAQEAKEKYNVDSVPTFIVDETRKVTDLKNYDDFKKDLLNKK